MGTRSPEEKRRDGAVTILFVWCLIKVLTGKKNPEHLAHVEPVETKDLDRR